MVTLNTARIPKARFYHPQRNLPGRSSGHTAEGRFTNAFIRAYVAQVERIHSGSARCRVALAREIPVNGYGIADIVSVAWDDRKFPGKLFATADGFIELAAPMIRSFEVKLSDWRTGMLQAHRYRFYSNAGILVLPKEQLRLARRFLHTFKTIRVGLWGFDPETDRILTIYTPRPAKPRDPRYAREAIRRVQNASKALPFSQTHSKHSSKTEDIRRRLPALV